MKEVQRAIIGLSSMTNPSTSPCSWISNIGLIKGVPLIKTFSTLLLFNTSLRVALTLLAFVSLSHSAIALSPRTLGPLGDLSKVSSSLLDRQIDVGHFRISWIQASAQVTIRHRDDTSILWQTRPHRAFVLAQNAAQFMNQWRGSFTWTQTRGLAQCHQQTIDAIDETPGAVTIRGQLRGPFCQTSYRLNFSEATPARLKMGLSVEPNSSLPLPATKLNEVFLNFATSPDEHVFGFGAQFTHANLKGREVPVLSTEQGHLRGLQPYSFILNRISPGAAGSWYTTYAAMPYYLTSRLQSLFLENSEMSFFDFSVPDMIEIRLRSLRMSAQLIFAQNPLGAIEAFTDYAGRMPEPPQWLHQGAIVGKMGGSTAVRQLWEKLQQRETPIAGFWLQDWVGLRKTSYGTRLWWNWQLDESLYPDWDQLVRELDVHKIPVLGYANPFLTDITGHRDSPRNLFLEAKAKGYLVTQNDDTPYEIDSGGFTGTLVDLTHPEAFAWYKKVLLDELVGRGMKGWMADFGEALPFDAKTYSGLEGSALHNLYTVLWAKLNREVLDESPLKGDGTVFLRCAYTQSPRFAPLFWLGDQMTSWDEHDGMRSAVTGLLSSGISGMALNHADIGGLISFKRKFLGIPLIDIFRTRELLLRWIEWSAFTPFYRTHEGNNPESSIQVDSDGELLDRFAQFAKIYAALAPYRQTLFKEAHSRGLPLVRHLWLHYPDDPQTKSISDQWLLGPDLLVAPVLDPDKSDRTLYLPPGSWTHLWSGQTYDVGAADHPSEGKTITVPSPLGQPPVFYRAGSSVGDLLKKALAGLE
jgi:alpha-glucosidase